MAAGDVDRAVSGQAAIGSPARDIRAVAIARPVLDLLNGASCLARVHSAFPRAVYLEVDRRMLALTSRATPPVPNGITLACEDGHPALLGLRPGQEARIGAGEIWFPQSGVRVVTGQAECWDPSLAVHIGTVEATRLARGFLHLTATLTSIGVGGQAPGWQRLLDAPDAGIGLPLLRARLVDALDQLTGALARGDQLEVVSSVCQLAGLGPGLTPAGDDLLVGACAALSLLACTSPAVVRPAETLLHLCRLVAEVATSRTTALSAVWLGHAGAGEFSQPVLALAQALAAEQERGLTTAAATLVRQGASSGRCMLAGLLATGQALTTGSRSLREDAGTVAYSSRHEGRAAPAPCGSTRQAGSGAAPVEGQCRPRQRDEMGRRDGEE
jgi:hypothetical protein